MSSFADKNLWRHNNFPLPISFDDGNSSGSISPLSLSHTTLNTHPYNSFDALDASVYDAPNTRLYLKTEPAEDSSPELSVYTRDHKYSKQAMVYRAIDERIDLVRFLQAYESVLSAFGVKENILADLPVGEEREKEREKLEVAERIVFRLFWNYGSCAGKSKSGSVPLARFDTGSPVTSVNTSRSQRVTSSETRAINAIVDQGYEGLRVVAGPVINIVGKEDQMTSMATKVKDVADETGVLAGGNTASEIVDGCSFAAEQITDKKAQMTSTVTEVVGVTVCSEPSIGEEVTCEIVDGGLLLPAGPTIDTTEKIGEMTSTVTEVAEILISTAMISEATSEATNEDPSTVIFIKSEPDPDPETLYEEMMKSSNVLLLRRWGRDRYAEWVQENGKAEEAQDEDAKKENFRLMELKHRLLPLMAGKLPYTYRIISSTQNHRDSYTGLTWGFNVAQRIEEFLNVRFQWTCEAGIHNDITVEPISLDELATDEIRGHEELENAYAFLGFWDWLVRQNSYSFEGKVRPMHEICLHWLDPHSVFRKAYFQKRPDSNSSEKVKREHSISREPGGWREKRTVSGASYVGGKKRCVSGGGCAKGNKRTATRNSRVERREDKMDKLNRGMSGVKGRTAFNVMNGV